VLLRRLPADLVPLLRRSLHSGGIACIGFWICCGQVLGFVLVLPGYAKAPVPFPMCGFCFPRVVGGGILGVRGATGFWLPGSLYMIRAPRPPEGLAPCPPLHSRVPVINDSKGGVVSTPWPEPRYSACKEEFFTIYSGASRAYLGLLPLPLAPCLGGFNCRRRTGV